MNRLRIWGFQYKKSCLRIVLGVGLALAGANCMVHANHRSFGYMYLSANKAQYYNGNYQYAHNPRPGLGIEAPMIMQRFLMNSMMMGGMGGGSGQMSPAGGGLGGGGLGGGGLGGGGLGGGGLGGGGAGGGLSF